MASQEDFPGSVAATDLPPGLKWGKASMSRAGGACFELAEGPDGRIYLRDSKNPDKPAFVMAKKQFAEFLESAKTDPKIAALAEAVKAAASKANKPELAVSK